MLRNSSQGGNLSENEGAAWIALKPENLNLPRNFKA